LIARAVVHVHSEWSFDGSWPLTKLASFFSRLGYKIMLTAEHDKFFSDKRWEKYKRACAEASTNKLLIIPGIEYSDIFNVVHIMAWGNMPYLGPIKDIELMLRCIYELNGVSVMSHPSRKYAWKKFNISWAPLLSGIELWNRKFDGVAPSNDAQMLLKKYNNLMPFVGLDFHRINQLFPLAMKIHINGILNEQKVLKEIWEKRISAEVFRFPSQIVSNECIVNMFKTIENLRIIIKKIIKRKKENRDH